MYDRILVALDGSVLAEQIVPHVEALAERFGSTVILLRAIPPPSVIIPGAGAGAEPVAGAVVDPTPIVEAERQQATTYLEAVADRLKAKGYTVDCEEPEGHADEILVRRARDLGVGLIALTTHGRGGLARAIFGSVADAVLRKAPCPVLLVRASETGSQRA
jgi:nucleotide-binding universal stress UspA family protein